MLSNKEIIEIMRPKKKLIRRTWGLSTSSTPLNLALTGKVEYGFHTGHYYLLVGDSAAGKTWFAHAVLAEASIYPTFDKYHLDYDNAEHGALMNVGRYFGQRLAKRIEYRSSESLEQCYDHLDDLVESGDPFIGVVDSMDVLEPEADDEKIAEQRKARAKGNVTEVSGSYGVAKAKINSNRLRRLIPKLRKTDSILIILSQTRDNIGVTYGSKKTRAGGKALKFYATAEMWLSVKQKLKKTVNKKPRTIGIITQISVHKNRVTGEVPTVEVPIYMSTGIDDVGSCVEYLTSEGYWSKGNAKDFKIKGTTEQIVRAIEAKDLEGDLKVLVKNVWDDIQAKCAVKRKNKYAEKEG